MKEITVAVVDAHHHALEHIHFAIRRRALPFQNIGIVHFDAHPDMSFSSEAPVGIIYDPTKLYDMLDKSLSGIAEFLLPLIHAGHVSSMIWIKQRWSQQIPIGHHSFRVGTHKQNKTLKVTSHAQYFIEDDLYAPKGDLEPTSKHLDYHVCELEGIDLSAVQALSELKSFILDIDLDYFSTWNPFHRDFVSKCGKDKWKILEAVFNGTMYSLDVLEKMHLQTRLEHRNIFVESMKRIQEEQLYLLDEDMFLAQLRDLIDLYKDQTGVDILRAFYEMLGQFSDEQREMVWWAGPYVDLPSHETSMEDIRLKIKEIQEFLRSSSLGTPGLITIAKSVSDEFLPPHQQEEILNLVSEMLKETYEETKMCKLLIAYDEYE